MTSSNVNKSPAFLIEEARNKADESLRLYFVSTANVSDEDIRKSTRCMVATLSELRSMLEDEEFKQVMNNGGYDIQHEFNQAIAHASGNVDDSNIIEPLNGYLSAHARLNNTFHSLDKLRALVPRIQLS